MLTIKNISFSYNKKVKVLDNISLNIENGIHSLVGLNGVGKTTLLNIIVGVLTPVEGLVCYKKRNKTLKFISYIPYENYFFSYITGREYISMFHGDTIDAFYWCDKLDIPLDSFISEYSSGMKKKIAIIAGIKKEKEIYIFDEPFNGLDLESRYQVTELMRLLKEKGKIIIITSHIIDILKGFTDFFYLLSAPTCLKEYKQKDFNIFEKELTEIIKNKSH